MSFLSTKVRNNHCVREGMFDLHSATQFSKTVNRDTLNTGYSGNIFGGSGKNYNQEDAAHDLV